ncbi:hypothetical protein ACVCNR_11180 [Aquamicrobium terrae]
MRVKISVLAAVLSVLPIASASAACMSNINGGTTMNEGDCYRHSNGQTVGCHGGQLGVVGGTTNKCKAWIKVERLSASGMGSTAHDANRASKGSMFSSNPTLQN